MIHRRHILVLFVVALAGAPSAAQTLVATRSIARGAVVAPDAVAVRPGARQAGAADAPDAAVGRVARRAIAQGAIIRADALADRAAVLRGTPVAPAA